MIRKLTFTVSEEHNGIKVYTFLRNINGVSLTAVRRLKHTEGGILRNGEFVRTIDLVHTGDEITLNLEVKDNNIPPSDVKPEIIYEDADLLVINKPSGLAMHPTHNHQGDTLANAVSAYLAGKGLPSSFHAVGRLDKCTSGVVVCALNSVAAAKLNGKIHKEYNALAEGETGENGTIDKPIYRPDPGKTYRAVGPTGDRAVTHWEKISGNGEISLVRVTLETGRTHQIRVHFASEGHPLCGDEMYGGHTDYIGRAALHCRKAEFIHPVTNELMCFEAPLPVDMEKIKP